MTSLKSSSWMEGFTPIPRPHSISPTICSFLLHCKLKCYETQTKCTATWSSKGFPMVPRVQQKARWFGRSHSMWQTKTNNFPSFVCRYITCRLTTVVPFEVGHLCCRIIILYWSFDFSINVFFEVLAKKQFKLKNIQQWPESFKIRAIK